MSAANVATAGSVESRLTQLGGLGYFNKAAFTTIANVGAINGVGGATGWGNSGVGIVLGPGQFNFDATIQKTTKVGGINENADLVFRTELFNIFNHPQYGLPLSDFSVAPGPGGFGNIVGTVSTTTPVSPVGTGTPREIQFSLRIAF